MRDYEHLRHRAAFHLVDPETGEVLPQNGQFAVTIPEGRRDATVGLMREYFYLVKADADDLIDALDGDNLVGSGSGNDRCRQRC